MTFARDALSFVGELCLVTPKDKLEKVINQNALAIYDILRIFEAVVYDRRDTTVPDDLVIVLKWLGNHLAFCVFKILMRSTSQCVVFKASVLMNCIFQGMGSRQTVESYQRLILNHSTLLLRNVELLLMPVSKRQKQISVVLLYNCLNSNPAASALMTRIIPKSLFRKVDSTSNDISKWTLIQWEELFDRINTNYSTAVEQWDDDCRLELLHRLRLSQNEFEDHWSVLEPFKFRDMVEATQKSRDGQLDSGRSNILTQLRWNYEEYEVKYTVLELKLPVWKYYLEQLYVESEEPGLLVQINNPKKFWEELSIQLISREDYYVRKKIIQTMILVYKEYSEKIKDLSLLPYLIKVLSTGADDDGGSFQYLVLQLIFTSLNITDELISSQNIRNFNEKGGLQIVRTHLSKKYFFENLDELSYPDVKKLALDKAAARKKTQTTNYFMTKSAMKDSITYNFSSVNLQREAYSQHLRKANEILLCLHIVKVCVARTKSQSEDLMLFPRPFARQMISEKESVNLFNQLLLIRDSKIVIITQEIVSLAYFNRFSYKHITSGTNYTERTLCGLSDRSNGERAAMNFREIYFLVQQDAPEEIKKMLGRFSTYGYLDTDTNEENETDKEKSVKDKIFDMFPLFKSLPWAMIFILIRSGWDEFAKIFYSNNFQMPNLLWTAEMRKQLLADMKEKFRGEFDRLKINHEKFLNNKLSVGIFEPLFQPSRFIEYKAVNKELVCDNIFLKFWVMPEYEDFDLQETQIPRMTSRLHRMMEKKIDSIINDPSPEVAIGRQEKIKDIYIILKADLKILEKYTVTNEHSYVTLEKILKIYNSIVFDELGTKNAAAINIWELVIGNVFKIVTYCLSPSVKENLEEFRLNIPLKTSILTCLSRILNRLINDSWCSVNSLRILHQFIKALKQIHANMVSPSEVFADVDCVAEDCYNLFEILNLTLHPYQMYFSFLIANNYSTIYESNRMVDEENVRRSIYMVFSAKESSDMNLNPRGSLLSPRAEYDSSQLDPSLSNIVDLLKVKNFSTGFSFVVEDKVLRLAQDTLEIIDELCDQPTCATNLVSSYLYYRLFQVGSYYIPREIRNSPDYTAFSNYQLTEKFKTLSDIAFHCLQQLTVMLLEGSMNAGNTHLEELLKDMDTASFNKIKENADTIRFEDNKKLENALGEFREFFGDSVVRGLVKVYLEPDRLDMLRDDLVSSGVDNVTASSIKPKEDINHDGMGWGNTSSLVWSRIASIDKIKVNIADIREKLEKKVLAGKREETRKVVGLVRASIAHSNTSELCIQGVYVTSYVHSPYRLDKPVEFVTDCAEKVLVQERKNHQNLLTILSAVKSVIRDEPYLDMPQPVVEKIVQLYSEIEDEWTDIKNLISDIFIALSTTMINLNKEENWVSSILFHRMLQKIFYDYNGSQSDEAYQLMIKWSLVVSQILNTECGLKAMTKYQQLLGMSKIAFEQTFTHFLRVKFSDCILRMYHTDGCPLEYMKMIEILSEVTDLKGSLTGEHLAKEIEKEQINPSFVLTRISAYKNRERYNRDIKAVIDKMSTVIENNSIDPKSIDFE